MIATMQDFCTILYVLLRDYGLLRKMYECLYRFWMNYFWTKLFGQGFRAFNFIISCFCHFIIYYIIYYFILLYYLRFYQLDAPFKLGLHKNFL